MLTKIQTDAIQAAQNEAETKGWDCSHQAAYDAARIYADMYGHDVDDFREALLSQFSDIQK